VKVEENRWYEHVPEPIDISQDNQVTTLWNKQIVIDRTTPHNQPNIILRHRKGTCLLIDISAPCDVNVLKKEAGTEIQRSIDRGTAHVECDIEDDTSNHRCNWKPIKIISEVFRRHPGLTEHRTAEHGHAKVLKYAM
jgi:hypothetical protein